MRTTSVYVKNINVKLICLLILCVFVSFAQPTIQWQKCYGGSVAEGAYSTIPTSDGGYITIGDSRSVDLDITGPHGVNPTLDIWILKTDILGNMQWKKCFGGSYYDVAPSIIQTADGGYIFAGTTSSTDGDPIGQHGPVASTPDAWVVKLDASGNIQWQRCLGGSGSDYGRMVRQTSDGGYIVGAVTGSNDGDVTGNHGGTDLWIVKLDISGNTQWQKALGGTYGEGGYQGMTTTGYNFSFMGLEQTTDGGYFVTTGACSGDGDLTSHYGGNNFLTEQDYWLVKLNSSGVIQWQKSFGGTGMDRPNAGFQTQDGGFIVVGLSNSNDGDVV